MTLVGPPFAEPPLEVVPSFLISGSFMFLRFCFLCFLLIPWSGVSSPVATAQTSSQSLPTIKTKVQRVLVDVVVTNDKGDAVTGLRKEDFQIEEDGKPQTIMTFEEHHGAAPTEVTLPPMPEHVYTNFPVLEAADAVNVLLLDALNTPSRDQVYVHAQMLKYLQTIPPGTRVAIFTLASRLRMLQGVTTDSKQVLAALKTKNAGTQSSPLLASDAENDANQHFVDFLEENSQGAPPKTLADAAVNPIYAAKQFLADTSLVQTELRIGITLDAMQQLARYLANVPGRKNLVWFSGSFPVNVFPDPDIPDPFTIASSFQEDERQTADLMAASRMAVYPIAAEGLMPDAVFQANASEIAEKRPSLMSRDQVKQLGRDNLTRDLNHRAMEELAKDTGGHAFYNTNGLSDALARVVSNGTRYYSITYDPTDAKMDGKFRNIRVKLAKGKYSLAYRRGYYADDLETALGAGKTQNSDPLLALMARNLPEYTGILYKVLVQPSNPQPTPASPRAGTNPDLKGPITRYGVDFAIATRDLHFQPSADGSRHGQFEVALIAYDREGKPLNFVVSNGDYKVRPDVYANLQKVGLQIHKEIDVPKAYVYLRTGVYDVSSGTAGTLGVPLGDAQSVASK